MCLPVINALSTQLFQSPPSGCPQTMPEATLIGAAAGCALFHLRFNVTLRELQLFETLLKTVPLEGTTKLLPCVDREDEKGTW